MPQEVRNRHRRDELDTAEDLRAHLAEGASLRRQVVQAIDLSAFDLDAVAVEDAIFLGCRFRDPAQANGLLARGAAVFPALRGFPYNPYRSTLYRVDELLEGYEAGGYVGTRDFRIYAHFDRERSHADGISIRESLAQSLHDHAIDDALQEMLEQHAGAGVVGIMGGHGSPRGGEDYLRVALLARLLTRAGYLVASGGGPGIMEAANLGAWCAPRDEAVLREAVELLSGAETYHGGHPEGSPEYLEAIEAYFARARQVVAAAGEEPVGTSLAIPTWFYGHEPTNLFATHVAKYFSNSLREDGLLAISTAGVVFAPGSAGTLQEVFMDLCQNHYATFTYRSPMVFLGSAHYRALFGFLGDFVDTRGMRAVYGDLLSITDEPAEALAFIAAHPPRAPERRPPLYELHPPPSPGA